MDILGVSLLIGASLAPGVLQNFSSITKTAQKTSDSIEDLEIGKYWADELLKIKGEIEENTLKMAKLGETAEDIELNQNLIARLEDAKKKAAEFGISLKNAAEESERLGGELEKVETAAQKMELKTEGFNQLRTAAMDFAKLSGGVMAAKSAFMGIVSPAVAFESNMASVSTLVDTSEVNMEKLSGKVLDVSKNFGLSTETVSKGMYQALSAGVAVENLGGFMETAAKMAVGGGIDIATAIDGMSSAVNAYGAANLSAQKASDIMFQTAKRGKTDVGKLAATLSNVTPIASSIGVKFGDVSAAIATLTYSGTPTSTATIGIANALTELSKEGTDASKMFKRLTGQSFKDYIASGHNMGEAFNAISQGAKMQNVELVDLLHNTSGAKAVMTLTGAAAGRFSEDLKEMGNSAGATEEAFDKMKKTTAQRMAEMQAGLDDVKITIGEAFVPAMLSIGQAVSKIITPIGEFISQHPTLIENMTWATAAAIGLYGALKLGLIIGSLVNAYKNYQKVAKGATVIQWAWNAAMTANPIGLVIAGVAALVGLAYVVYKNWEPIVDWFKGVFGWLGDAIGSFFGKTDKLKAEVKKDESATVKVEKEKEKELPKIGDALKAKQSEAVTEKSDFSSFKTAPTQNKTVNVTISNFTVNAQNIEEALPKIVDRVREAIKQGIKDDMENSYAY